MSLAATLPAIQAPPSHPIFDSLGPADRHLLSGLTTRRTLRRGTTLFWEGTPASMIALVLDGRIKQYRTTRGGRDLLVDFAGPGGVVGLLALLDGGPLAVTATAVCDTEVLLWRVADVHPILKARPHLQAALLPWALQTLRQAWDRISEMGQNGVPARLASLLLRLCRDQGLPTREGVRLALPLTHLDLAALIGTTRESVTRTMADFRRTGALVPAPDDEWLVRVDRLAPFADI